MMRVSLLVSLLAASDPSVNAFVTRQQPVVRNTAFTRTTLHSTTSSTEEAVKDDVKTPRTKTLGLLTFDLDDTIYPLAPVIEEANAAFARAMDKYGFPNIAPTDINTCSIQIRTEIAVTDPERAAVLSHTEIRRLAIRKEMEKVMLNRKLKECAEDWATNVESLGPAVVGSARKWSSKAVSSSVVDAVLTAWEMERHHASERHLYSEVLPALKQIKQDHPGVIIGAVTDGKANPMFMTFTLAKSFDFCINWEDDQGGRRKFFQELSKVEGNAELSWIYNAAKDKGKEMADAAAAIKEAAGAGPSVPPIGSNDSVWIHAGDDLAYDVGGSAQCGAKTILVELADKYGQTARHRFDPDVKQPEWSVSSEEELMARSALNEAAKEFVDEKLEFWHLLPETVNKIVDEAGIDE